MVQPSQQQGIELISELGSGSYSVIYKAFDHEK